ncbi:uncharacterized protein C2845_PM13G02040 [Panicum miliaceum]|uniref:Uncharacterized protein n=1 Tax=Panicum miliaceum TaxID=4540 RepID=A0A3L6RIN2_PANMI|nr:uncharacterized protein C2845_PM13G02040 [Panicum miliaceum]
MPDVKPPADAAAAAGAKAAAGDAPSPAAAPAPAPAPAAANGNGTPQKPPPVPAAAFDMPKPNLRGLNKPKCIQCGNVARSRCPFQCCKACCYKAQNPCHIHATADLPVISAGHSLVDAMPLNVHEHHLTNRQPQIPCCPEPPVLKQTNTLPDKPSPTTAPLTEQPSTNLPATGSASRLACLQKLPHHFLNSLRTKKLAKKDVASINKWRFMKLKEHMQGDIDAENEAYERYTQNVGLLEETFCPMEDAADESEAEATSSEEERMDLLVSEAKVRLKSDNENADSFKERVATILDEKLKKLQESQSAYEDDKPSDQDQDDHTAPVKFSAKQKMERAAKFNELLGGRRRRRRRTPTWLCSRTDAFAQHKMGSFPAEGSEPEPRRRAASCSRRPAASTMAPRSSRACQPDARRNPRPLSPRPIWTARARSNRYRGPGMDGISNTVHPRSVFQPPSAPWTLPGRLAHRTPWLAGAPPRPRKRFSTCSFLVAPLPASSDRPRRPWPVPRIPETWTLSEARRRAGGAFSTRLAPLSRLHQVVPRKAAREIHISIFSYVSVSPKGLDHPNKPVAHKFRLRFPLFASTRNVPKISQRFPRAGINRYTWI